MAGKFWDYPLKDKLGSVNFWIGSQIFLKKWKKAQEKSVNIKIYNAFRKKIVIENLLKYYNASIQLREIKKN